MTEDENKETVETDDENSKLGRREFIAVAATTLALGGCAQTSSNPTTMSPISEAQKQFKRQGRSSVGVLEAQGYEDDLFGILKAHVKDLQLPDLKNKTVVLKPNLVEFHPGKPITTNPEVVWATAQLADYLGAKQVIVAEGPGHMRDSEFLLTASGVGPMCKKRGLEFIDLNLDDVEEVANPMGFTSETHFWLPKTIVHADAVISVPKMKTHHWVGLTAAMKNLFGTVPGRKYGWPKNILHWRGINNCIMDLQAMVKPTFAVVDGITAMEGDGPVNGVAKEMNLLIVGVDQAAVDSSVARLMVAPLDKINYIQMAGKVIGNIEESQIDIVGKSIDSVKSKFELPLTFTDKKLLANAGNQAS